MVSCSENDGYSDTNNSDDETTEESKLLSEVLLDTFGSTIDFENLENYANQEVPNYITRDNTAGNSISDEKATLGRILFYDTNLSVNNMISCASCHQQASAFGDHNDVSLGVNGVTARHSMRLVNARFSDENRFFWDERAQTLEDQTTQPIQDHLEMGFSGEDGAPSFSDVLEKLSRTDYYPLIFNHIYGDNVITEPRIQEALAQFVRSIQSFDSPYDVGRAGVNNATQNFPNYSASQNRGKALFLNPQNQGGVACAGCHRPDDFSIDPNSRNNGVTGVFANEEARDFTITRAPSLRDLVNASGNINGAFMHDASLLTLDEVLRHYNTISLGDNPNLDNRLQGGPDQDGQQLNLTEEQIDDLVHFLQTLTGEELYTASKWSNPF